MDKQAFVDRLRLCMLNKQLNGKKLTAYRLDKENIVKQSTMENYLKGTTIPDIEVIANLADYFGVTTDWLITGVEPEDKIFHDDPKDDILNLLKKQQKMLDNHQQILEKLVSIVSAQSNRDESGSPEDNSRA